MSSLIFIFYFFFQFYFESCTDFLDQLNIQLFSNAWWRNDSEYNPTFIHLNQLDHCHLIVKYTFNYSFIDLHHSPIISLNVNIYWQHLLFCYQIILYCFFLCLFRQGWHHNTGYQVSIWCLLFYYSFMLSL